VKHKRSTYERTQGTINKKRTKEWQAVKEQEEHNTDGNLLRVTADKRVLRVKH
jgi:hypothetical protein